MNFDWERALADVEGQRVSLETILTDRDYFGLTTATPLQRGICRLVAGDPLGDLVAHPHILETIGHAPHLAGKPPKEVYIAAGIRCGKSLLNAAAIVYCAFNGDFRHLGPGEIPRASIVSVEKDLAEVTMSHLLGRCEASPVLRQFVRRQGDFVYIRQPHTGREVEVAVVANKRDGASLVARWQVVVSFEEVSRFASGSDSVINIENTRAATLERLVPGGLVLGTGSPTAPFGFFYDVITRHTLNPTQDLVAIKAPAYLLNPTWWTPERCEEARRRDPEVYRTDVLAEFSSPESSMFNPTSIERATLRGIPRVPYEDGYTYIAAQDAATRSNGWSLVIATRKGNTRQVVYANEWKGSTSDPLDSNFVMREMAEVLAHYHIRTVHSDMWMADSLMERAREHGFHITVSKPTPDDKSKAYRAVQDHLDAGKIQIVDNKQLRADLIRVKKVPLPSGGVAIKLPFTNDGRHCDYIPSFVAALWFFCRDYEASTPPQDPSTVFADKLKTERLKQQRRNIQKRFR